MTQRLTFAAFALLALVAVAPHAWAEYPTITWSPDNQPMGAHVTGDLTRDWTWSCDDQSDEFPLTAACRVFDFTLGGLGSGQEIVIEDTDCGTFSADPFSVTHLYQIPAGQLVTDHQYAYAAFCRDTSTNPGPYSFTSWRWFWYDASPPTVEIVNGPAQTGIVGSPTAAFEFTCNDTSFSYNFGSFQYEARCNLFCALYDQGAPDTPLIAAKACDTTFVTDAQTLAAHTFGDLGEGSYRFELYGRDRVGLESEKVTWEWTNDPTAPDTELTSTPPELDTSLTPAFEFTCTESGCSYHCTLVDETNQVLSDGACVSGDSFVLPGDGVYTFVVLATDPAGNADVDPLATTVSQYSWTVDTTPPAAPLITSPADGATLPHCQPLVTGTAEPGATVQVRVDGALLGTTVADANGDWTYTFLAEQCLEDGLRTLSAIAVDEAGNSSTPDSVDVTVAHDSDGDGLSDAIETSGGNATDPNKADSDADGLCDGPGTVVGVCAAGEDKNADGELSAGETDPNNPDTDGGCISDGDEVINAGTDPLNDADDDAATSQADCDGDGLSGIEETDLGSDPRLADTDGDGLDDGDEIDEQTNPLVPDTDGDGATDGAEVHTMATEPLLPDTDGDGLCDGPGTDTALCPAGGEDKDANGRLDDGETDPLLPDTDGGEVDDGAELAQGTDPRDPGDDFPLVLNGRGPPGGCGAAGGGPSLAWLLALALLALALTARRARPAPVVSRRGRREARRR